MGSDSLSRLYATSAVQMLYKLPECQGNYLYLKGIKLVEAAGVEPASEKAHRAKPTCVSDSGVSATPYKTGKSESRLVRLISAP